MKPPLFSYALVRDHMLPGDVIAFGGSGLFSWLIKRVTRSTVSHVGVVMDAYPNGSDRVVKVIESTSLDGRKGVIVSRMSERVTSYAGDVWWLPLSPAVRYKLDEPRFFRFLHAQDGKRYDVLQAVLSPLRLDFWNAESYGRMFCSELVVGALEAAGAISKVNASRMTPHELIDLPIYAPEYCQLKGSPREIPGWGEGKK